MALIKCSGCGHMISDKVSKCPKCGMPIEKAESVFTEEKKEMVNTEVNPPKVESISSNGRIKENTRNNKNGIVAAICGIVIFIIAVGSFILWKNSNGYSSSGYIPQLVNGNLVYSTELVKNAKNGNREAQLNLGNCYYEGYGVEQNYSEAVRWYRKAAEQGEASAQLNLGACYFQGNGVEQNDAEAVRWYRKAAEQGKAIAQFNLGLCYYNGFGIEQNYSEAVRWYRKAAEQGEEHAIEKLNEIGL